MPAFGAGGVSAFGVGGVSAFGVRGVPAFGGGGGSPFGPFATPPPQSGGVARNNLFAACVVEQRNLYNKLLYKMGQDFLNIIVLDFGSYDLMT